MNFSRAAKITLFCQDFKGGGAERMMVNIAEGLSDRGHNVEFVVVRREGPFLSRIPSHIPVFDLGTRRVSQSILALSRYLRNSRPDAILSTLVHVNVALILARRLSGIPTRVVVREANCLAESAKQSESAAKRLCYLLLPWLYRWSERIVGISHGLTAELRQRTGLGPERLITVHNPVLSSRDLMEVAAPSPAPHPWLQAEEPPVVLAVGRLVRQKDHPTLIEAFARLRRQISARLVILGDGVLRESLIQQIHALGLEEEVLMPGFVASPLAWMKHAAVLAHSARWEGFGNVLVEALAVGLPVVSTDCPSGPAEILDDGRYGKLVPIRDVEAMADALVSTLTAPTPRELLIRRSREFTVDAIAEQYEAILLGREI